MTRAGMLFYIDRDQFAIMAKILAGVSGRFILSKKRSSHYTAIVQSI